jgi:hypothetical protein
MFFFFFRAHYFPVLELLDHGSTSKQGTNVNVGAVKTLVEDAVKSVQRAPTCLHDVKDTVRPLYGHSGLFTPK